MANEGKTVIVTGASKGLGRAVAKILADYRANVVLTARSENLLRNVSDDIRSQGGSVISVPGDVSNADDCMRVVREAVDSFGRLDAIVNNAGVITPIAPLENANLSEWQHSILINLMGPVNLTRFALPELKKTKGTIVNVSSGAAVKVAQGWSAYCAAKAALNHFNRVIAEEEPDVISVALRPGVVATDMQAVIREDGLRGMPRNAHAKFVAYYEEGTLLDPSLPGKSIAVLALNAPTEWSGEFIQWDEDRVIELIQSFEQRR